MQSFGKPILSRSGSGDYNSSILSTSPTVFRSALLPSNADRDAVSLSTHPMPENYFFIAPFFHFVSQSDESSTINAVLEVLREFDVEFMAETPEEGEVQEVLVCRLASELSLLVFEMHFFLTPSQDVMVSLHRLAGDFANFHVLYRSLLNKISVPICMVGEDVEVIRASESRHQPTFTKLEESLQVRSPPVLWNPKEESIAKVAKMCSSPYFDIRTEALKSCLHMLNSRSAAQCFVNAGGVEGIVDTIVSPQNLESDACVVAANCLNQLLDHTGVVELSPNEISKLSDRARSFGPVSRVLVNCTNKLGM